MLMLRGIAMGMLFIPITTLSLSTLKGKQIGDGAAFTGMMRQLGGSFGIAAITTFMATRNMLHRSDLVSKMDITNPATQNRVNALQHGFMAKGIPANIAQQDAYKALDYAIAKQASVLSYMDVFLYIGVLFLVCIPLVLLVKGNKGKKISLAEAAH
jgi:DHA2 family multidrug resistance protein